MKKILLLVLSTWALNGCTLIDAYLMTKYDSNEYRIISEIRTDAAVYKGQCNDDKLSKDNADSIARKTLLFEIYSEQIPRNSNGISASKELNKIAQGLKERYAGKDLVGPVFCKLKFGSIENSAQTIQHVIGARPR